MPETSHRAEGALIHIGQVGRGAKALRIAVGAVFALALLAVPPAADPAPVAAGSSCTGWHSKTKPPKTIRVLRTRSGRVETVNFRTYVAEVMASGEWPTWLRKSTLEAGALAVKQYAWHYALKGKHRPNYVKGGKCYDVRDDTQDQIYRPERAQPTTRQYKAVDDTWALSLRKNGRFFLTGYRSGTTKTCAADANGWKLYAKSVNNCAKKGWSSTRILKRYLSPNLKFVWSDETGPVIRPPIISLKAGNSIASGAATVSWRSATDPTTVAKYFLQRKTDGGSWKYVELPGDGVTRADVWVKPGSDNRFRVRAKDSQGRFGPWSYISSRKVALRGPIGRDLTAESIAVSDTEPPKVKTSFKGRAAALVAQVGPGMGKAKVFVNGKQAATIDLDRETADDRALVWALNWSRTKIRTLAVRAVRDGKPVEFNGFVTLR